ncbi:MAG: PIN domain-containing protein [candidate division NC10 bacterium]|nr:PIN domain-containing protein [candidate division NC10 bacterium]
MYLLDTNALSELVKKRPHPGFIQRLRRHPADAFFTSCICVMELRQGASGRVDTESFWGRIVRDVVTRFSILGFGTKEAIVAGDLLAHLAKRGEVIGLEDVLIGSTALVRDFTVVTANVRHFQRIPDLRVENWIPSRT